MSFEHWETLQELHRMQRKEAHRISSKRKQKEMLLLLLDGIGTMIGMLLMLAFIYVMLIAFFG